MEGGKGLLSIRCIEIEKQNLSLHLDQSEKRLLRLSKNVRKCQNMEDLYLRLRNAKKKKKKQKRGQEKQLDGKFVRKTKEVRSEETWGWTRKGF